MPKNIMINVTASGTASGGYKGIEKTTLDNVRKSVEVVRFKVMKTRLRAMIEVNESEEDIIVESWFKKLETNRAQMKWGDLTKEKSYGL